MDIQFTQDWWKRTTADESKLIAWLMKLHGTELGGYDDYSTFLTDYLPDERTSKILTNIAEDEKKHANLIASMLDGRGYRLYQAQPSEYWAALDSHITDITSACAANYYGEALAAFRFEVIIDMPCTPKDVKEILNIILPDEQFHRTTLKRMAGDEQLEKFKAIHEDAMAKLKGKK